MAARNYFDSVNPEGFGPNHRVEEAGYTLPTYYSQAADGNNIQALSGGWSTADDAWGALITSSGTRRQLLGEIDFYAKQIEYGIGHVYDPDSEYKHYWVIITAVSE